MPVKSLIKKSPPKSPTKSTTKSPTKSPTKSSPTKSTTKSTTKSSPTKSPTKILNGNGKILVIVESPGKIKKIQDILGDSYVVSASVGHIIDLAAKTMSIDIENNFKPEYEILSGKESIVKQLKALSKTSSDILLATDEDREGEMIAWSLAYTLGINNAKRIAFNSITEKELLNAVKNPRKIDMDLVDAQKSRRILDRLVGYEISPLLWKSIGQSLSAGRVQSVVSRLIIDREKDIKEFLSKEIKSAFKFKAIFNKNIISSLYQTKKPDGNIDGNIDSSDIDSIDTDSHVEQDKQTANDSEKISGTLLKGYKAIILTEKMARELLKKMSESEYKIIGKGEKLKFKNPSPPFTTSTLQQESSRKLGFAVKRTMMAAQNLYEAGHITYMRTDSTNLSEEALKSIGQYILDVYGKSYHVEKNYKGKSKNTQEAHEAIRPTHIEIKGLSESGKIGSDELKLYQLIWKRAIASQMAPAKFSVATTHISISKLKDYYYSTEIDTLIFDGFLKVYNLKNLEETDETNISTKIPQLGEKLQCSNITATQEYERPEPRYDEASLINKLDPKNLNIGRPSTYATIINKIQERGYIIKKDNEGIEKDSMQLIFDGKKIEDSKFKISLGKDIGRLTPTPLGKIVTEFLIQYFPEIMDYKFTSDMEQKLDDVAEGKLVWSNLMDKFYNTEFHPIIENLKKEKIKFVDKDRKVIGKDPTSGEDIIVTMRRYGPVVMIEKGKKTLNIAPIKAPLTVDTITLENAIEILSYPKLLGKYEKKDIYLYRGKYGFYSKCGDKNINLSKFENEEDITVDVISELIKEVKKKYLWEGSEGKIEYKVLEGPYGKFINIKDMSKKLAKPLNIKFPEGIEIKDLTLDKIKNLVEEGKKTKFRRGKKN